MTRRRSRVVQPTLSRRAFGQGLAGLGLAGFASLANSPAVFAATPPSLKTVEPGFITVATIPVMPVTGVKDGAFIGTDGSMISVIAEKLGLKAKPAFMEWSATIESVKTGRADVVQALFEGADPLGRIGQALAQRPDLGLEHGDHLQRPVRVVRGDRPSGGVFSLNFEFAFLARGDRDRTLLPSIFKQGGDRRRKEDPARVYICRSQKE